MAEFKDPGKKGPGSGKRLPQDIGRAKRSPGGGLVFPVAGTAGLGDLQQSGADQKLIEAKVGVDPYHSQSDVDSSAVALHHTLGITQNQAAFGSHVHDGVDSREIQDLVSLAAAYYAHDHYGADPQDINNITNTFTNGGGFSWGGATTNPSVGNGTLETEYIRFGPLVYFTIKLTTGTTTGYGSGRYFFNLPFDVAGNFGHVVPGYLKNGPSPFYFAMTCFVSAAANQVYGMIPSSAIGAGANLLSSTGYKGAWAANDEIFVSGWVPVN